MINFSLKTLLAAVALIASTYSLGIPGLAQSNALKWNGNGHFYEVVEVPAGITWVDARAAAKAKGGDLASLATNEENRFVWSLIAGKPHL